MILKHKPYIWNKFKRYGDTITKSVLSGLACPCVDAETNLPSREWHRLNPAEEDCNGTGLIQSSRLETDLYGFVQPSRPEDLELDALGLRDETVFVYYGGVDENLNFVSLQGMDEKRDYLLYDGKRWVVRDVEEYREGDVVLLEAAVLVRIED